MNLLAIKIGIKTFGKRTVFFVQKHAPQILVGTGVAGFVGTAVASGHATLKAKDILDTKDELIEQYTNAANDPNEPLTEEDAKKVIKTVKRKTAVELVKVFAPPVTLGAASAAAVFCGHNMMGRRAAAALAGAYEAQTKLHQYRDRVAQELGTEVDQKLLKGVPLDKLDISKQLALKADEKQEDEKIDPETGEVVKPAASEDKYEWLFASETCGPLHGCGVWRDSCELNRQFLLRAERQAMDMLRAKGYLLINDILIGLFGADGTSYGATHGWVYYKTADGEEPVVDFGLNDLKNNPQLITFLNGEEPNVWLRFNCLADPIDKAIDAVHAHQYPTKYVGGRFMQR